jgi:hypothetical protein
MHLTLYRGARNPRPVQVDDLAWPDVVEAVRELLDTPPPAPVHKADGTRDVATEKKALLAIAPHRLHDGATRSASAVEHVSAIVIDVDACDIDAVDGALRDAGIAAIVYGSPSDDATAVVRRVRVIAPTSRAMAPDECDAARLSFAERLGLAPGSGVDGALGAERLFFVGALANTPARELRVYDGDPVDVDALPAPALAWGGGDTATAAPAPVDAPAAHDDVRAAGMAAITLALGDAGGYEGRKHDTCGAVGGVMRKCGWTKAECASVIRAWAEGHAEDLDHAVRWATRAWDRLPEEVSGTASLARIAGDRVAGAVEAAAMLPTRAGFATIAPEPERVGAAAAAVDDDGLRWGELSPDPPPQRWLIPQLEIGPGRAFGWLGAANASKTLTLMQLEVDVALRRPVFGAFSVRGEPRVMRIAYEGFVKAAEDYARLLRGALGKDVPWAALRDRLRFAEGRRHFGRDVEADREWLLRVTEWCAGGVVTIDPLVAACAGLDENSAEISAPIYTLESVASVHDLAFVVAHHVGHAATARSRGHSAIDGAWGASALVERDENSADVRHVTPKKRNRRGTEPFTLELHDEDEDGKPWTPTEDDIREGRASWALRIEARDVGKREARTSAREQRREAALQAKADMVVRELQSVVGIEARMSVSAARQLCSCSGADWPAVWSRIERAGVIAEWTNGRACELRLARSERAESPFTAPSRGGYEGIER